MNRDALKFHFGTPDNVRSVSMGIAACVQTPGVSAGKFRENHSFTGILLVPTLLRGNAYEHCFNADSRKWLQTQTDQAK